VSLLIGLLAGLSVAATFYTVVKPSGADVVRRRIEDMWAPTMIAADEEPFRTRVLKPLGEAMMRSFSRLLPQPLVSAVESRMQTAGMTASPLLFVVLWLTIGVFTPLVLLLLFSTGETDPMVAMLFFGWGAAGALLPWRMLNSKADARTKQIDKELPDVIDMIVTSVEAGLGMQQAMMTVADKFEGSVGIEFGRVLAETQLGRTRGEAMADMAVRTGSRDLTLFVRAVNQADEMGFAIGTVLRNQSHEIRERKEQSAREQAAKIPVKIIIPTTAFMLPTLFILILTPVILSAVEAFSAK